MIFHTFDIAGFLHFFNSFRAMWPRFKLEDKRHFLESVKKNEIYVTEEF